MTIAAGTGLTRIQYVLAILLPLNVCLRYAHLRWCSSANAIWPIFARSLTYWRGIFRVRKLFCLASATWPTWNVRNNLTKSSSTFSLSPRFFMSFDAPRYRSVFQAGPKFPSVGVIGHLLGNFSFGLGNSLIEASA